MRRILRPLLARRGLPSKNLRVTIGNGTATLRDGKLHAVVGARIVGLSSIRLLPRSGSAALRRALSGAIQVGPLFDGVHLTRIALKQGRATLTGAGAGGNAEGLPELSQASSTARVSRCWPTLRLTRCSALSTAFGSQSTSSPISS